MMHKWNCVIVIYNPAEAITGQLIYSPTLRASESTRAVRLKTCTGPNVCIALVVRLTATAGREGRPSELQNGVCQQ